MKRVLFAFILSSLILFGCGGKTDSKSDSFASASVKEPLIGVVISETGEVIYDADDYSRYLAQSNIKPEPVREINDTSDQSADSEIWTDNDVLEQNTLYSPELDIISPQEQTFVTSQEQITDSMQGQVDNTQIVSDSNPQQTIIQEQINPDDKISETADNNTVPSGSSHRGNVDNFYKYDIPEQQETTASYVLNSNTHKFHIPNCEWVKRIAPEHYLTSNDRADIIAQGYVPCKVCRP